jgi:hypothetical protein
MRTYKLIKKYKRKNNTQKNINDPIQKFLIISVKKNQNIIK